ncbi:MAG: hypothetical protein J6I89_02355 [Oscillospiraceae bacterium]|nr:hypothetical protein [Oscillospiraceae bacterium]MBQ7871524.1 hypothetical protein [Oscillospiraceae bacterium]
MKIEIISFGHKYGPIQADLVFDLRCLANPYWDPALRPLCGLDAPVQDYIFADPDSAAYLRLMGELVRLQVRLAEAKGSDSLRVAVGCTGGRHRSVAGAAYLAQLLGEHCVLTHRDLSREG